MDDDGSSDVHFVEDEQDYEFHRHTNMNLTKHIMSEYTPIVRDEHGEVVYTSPTSEVETLTEEHH